MLAEGDIAPEFTLPAHDGGQVSLSDLKGKWVVFWWYTMASTPG